MDTKEIEWERTMMAKHISHTNEILPIHVKFPTIECGESFIKTCDKAILFFDKPTGLYKRYAQQVKEILVKILSKILVPEMRLDDYEYNFTFENGKCILNVGKTVDTQFCCIYCVHFGTDKTHVIIKRISVGINKKPVTLKPFDLYDRKVIAEDSVRRIKGKFLCTPTVKRTNTHMNNPLFYEHIEHTNLYRPPVLKRQPSCCRISRE